MVAGVPSRRRQPKSPPPLTDRQPLPFLGTDHPPRHGESPTTAANHSSRRNPKIQVLPPRSAFCSREPTYRGMLGTVTTVAREEGPKALWKGLEPGIHRQCLFGGLRIGLYDPMKKLIVGKDHVGDIPLHLKIASGLATGALAIAVASPTDLVKVRMQAEGKLPEGASKKYPSAFKAYGIIARQEGVVNLWTGLGPNMARNAIINAAELASYDQIKQSLLKTGYFKDNVVTHLAAGLGAGFFAVCIGSPVDVVKSRIMGAPPGQYAGVVDCFVKTFRTDGVTAFYKGFIPNFGRLGSWNVAMFLVLEQAKAFVSSRLADRSS